MAKKYTTSANEPIVLDSYGRNVAEYVETAQSPAADHGEPRVIEVSIVRFDMSFADVFSLMFKFALVLTVAMILGGTAMVALFLFLRGQ